MLHIMRVFYPFLFLKEKKQRNPLLLKQFLLSNLLQDQSRAFPGIDILKSCQVKLKKILIFLIFCLPIISVAQDKKESTRISWLADKSAIVKLSEYIDDCSHLGLSREDYDAGFLASIINGDSELQDSTDTIAAESRLTYMAEAFFKDVLNGKP